MNTMSKKATDLMDLWNKRCPKLGRILKATHLRMRKTAQCLENESNLDVWAQAFDICNNHKRLNGSIVNGFKASYDWIIKDVNRHKEVIEKYGD